MPTDKLLKGHRDFKERFAEEREVFERLAEEGQDPKVLWIGCCDSRVIPEQITGADPGELFVVRNIANVVPPAGAPAVAVGAAVEFAVRTLKVAHAVVCGHTQCGGIRALDRDIDPAVDPHLAEWVRLLKPAREKAAASAESVQDRYIATIKANVLVQRANLETYSCVREARAAGRLDLHAWLYDLATGDLHWFDEESGKWFGLHAPGGARPEVGDLERKR